MEDVNLRRLGKVLLVEADSTKIQLYKAKLLQNEGTVVDVVDYEFAAFLRLSDPNHGYNLVFLGSQPWHPNLAKLILRDRLDIFAD